MFVHELWNVVWFVFDLIFTTFVSLGVLCIAFLLMDALTTLLVLAFGNIHKKNDGSYEIDSNSWHFRVAYPTKYDKNDGSKVDRSSTREFREIKRDGVWLCKYCARVAAMLWLAWPFKYLFYLIKLLFLMFYSIVVFPLGDCVEGRYWKWGGWMEDPFELHRKIEWLRRENGKTFKPILLAFPFGLIWLAYGFFHGQKGATVIVAVMVVIIAAVALVLLVRLIYRLTMVKKEPIGREDYVEKSLLTEWAKSTYKRLCPRASVK